jgi:diacylglycerol kinase
MKGFLKSFVFAVQGILTSLREHRNLKVQVVIGIITVGAGFYFHITATEWSIVLLTIGLVIGLELINTAIEKVVDLITKEWHPLAGKAKDMAAGAVLVASILAVIIGVIIFRKYCFTGSDNWKLPW